MNETRFSNSELQTFKDCKRKWYLAYFRRLGLKAPRTTGALATGNRVHDALEAYYRPGESDADVALETYAKAVDEDVEANPQDEERVRKDAEVGRIMLEGYFDWLEETGADAELEVIAPEEAIEKEWGIFDGVKAIFMGKIDIRVRHKVTGARMWLDHKTTNDMQTPVKIAYLDEQYKSYSLLEKMDAEERGDDDWADGGIINILKRVKRTASAKPPFYLREMVKYNDSVMKDIALRIRATIQDIIRLRLRLSAGEDHRTAAYPSPSKDCTWKCEFFPVCPLMDENPVYAESFLEDYFVQRDPYERYKEDDEA